MSAETVFFRVDAYTEIGLGHAMRCLSLAQELRRRGVGIVFLGRFESSLRERLTKDGVQVRQLTHTPASGGDLAECKTHLASLGYEAPVVLDGYHFDTSYMAGLRRLTPLLLVIDDIHCRERYEADVVLNQNLHGPSIDYNVSPGCRCLLGSEYIMLRREFIEASPRPQPEAARQLLLTMGGSDPNGAGAKIVRELHNNGYQGLLRVVAGPNNPHRAELEAALGEFGHAGDLVASSENMAKDMIWADAALSAGGSTCWELAHLGIPMVVVSLSPNQEPICHEIDRCGAGLCLGTFDLIPPGVIAQAISGLMQCGHERRAMSDRGRVLVDGRGVQRVADVLLDK